MRNNWGLNQTGEKNKSAKLSREKVGAIRHLLDVGFKQVELAKMFSVSNVTIWKIKEKVTWK